MPPTLNFGTELECRALQRLSLDGQGTRWTAELIAQSSDECLSSIFLSLYIISDNDVIQLLLRFKQLQSIKLDRCNYQIQSPKDWEPVASYTQDAGWLRPSIDGIGISETLLILR